MAQEYKETLEWKALSRIWKAIEPDKRQALMEDFRLLTDWIKKDMAVTPPPPVEAVPEGGFLNGCSPRAKALVLKRLTGGQGNLYDQCAELVQPGDGEDSLWARFAARFAGDRVLESENEIREILRICLSRGA